MSYAVSAAVQKAMYEALVADPPVGAIFDGAPEGEVPDTYAVIGAEDVRDRSSMDARLSEHRAIVTVYGAEAAFSSTKLMAGAICDRMLAGLPNLDRGRVVSIEFIRARARRVTSNAQRRIEMTFRLIVEDD